MNIPLKETEKDRETGRKKLLVEIDPIDIKIINDALAIQEESKRFDRDDKKYVDKFNHVKDQCHVIWTLLWPS